MSLESFPEVLRAQKNWLLWKYETRDGKLTKPPYNPHTDGYADTTDPSTWGTFEQALARAKEKIGVYNGLGFVFSGGYVGVDLDHCRDKVTGSLEDWAWKIIIQLNSYTEISPSEEGIHIIAPGHLPGKTHRNRKGQIEIYDLGRYFTVTGNFLGDLPTPLNPNAQEAITALHLELFGPQANGHAKTAGEAPGLPQIPAPGQIAFLITKMRESKNGGEIDKLWRGEYDTQHYTSPSEADLALMNHLAFWCNKNPELMREMFSQSTLGEREKWQRKDYQERTIAAAIGGVEEGYSQVSTISRQTQGSILVPPRPYTLDEIEAEVAALSQVVRIPSSIAGVDGLLGENGFAAPRLILYAGYTGGGKTSVLLTEGIGAALRGHPVLLVTLELSRFEIYRQKISKIFEFEKRPANLPFQILDGIHDLTGIVLSIENWLNGLNNKLTPIVVVDYAQKVALTTKENRERQVALVAEEFQRLGRKRNILIFLGAQLNRDSAKSDKPEIYHLRESGLLEQVADFVLLLQKTSQDRLKIYLAKHRWGTPDKAIEIAVDFARCTFGELTPTQIFRDLADSVVELLNESPTKTIKIRDACNSIRWKSKHPTKTDILAASFAIGSFKVDQSTLYFGVDS